MHWIAIQATLLHLQGFPISPFFSLQILLTRDSSACVSSSPPTSATIKKHPASFSASNLGFPIKNKQRLVCLLARTYPVYRGPARKIINFHR